MTSGFFIPDLTLGVAASRALIEDSDIYHDEKRCTVCHKARQEQNPAESLSPLSPKTAIPVSQRPVEDLSPDATSRPSEPPLKALSRVIQEIGDEITHLKLQVHETERELAAHDPATGKQRREEIESRMSRLVKALSMKADQIYSLYDVLEGHQIDHMAQTRRRVTIKSPSGDDLDDDSEGESDAEWDGFTDTGSMRIDSILRSVRA